MQGEGFLGAGGEAGRGWQGLTWNDCHPVAPVAGSRRPELGLGDGQGQVHTSWSHSDLEGEGKEDSWARQGCEGSRLEEACLDWGTLSLRCPWEGIAVITAMKRFLLRLHPPN